ncbi:MAG: GNAT family N-acetyltransferase [Gammaproteobacteria bacterium]
MYPDIRIHLAARTDVQPIAWLSRLAIERGLQWSWTPTRVLACIEDGETNVIVARRNGRLAGFAVMKYEDSEAHLLLLGVPFSERRRGIGTALLSWLEVTVKTAGIEIVKAETRAGNAAARNFYRKNGYTESVRLVGYYDGREDAVGMEKRFPVLL